MTTNLFTFVTMFDKVGATLDHLVDVARAHAKEHEIDEGAMLEWQLAEDMFPLRKQAQIVLNFVGRWPSRVAGVEEPPEASSDSATFDELKAGIATAREALTRLTPDMFEERGDVPLTLNLGTIEPTMPLSQWLTGFATTNLYFHLSILYAILRARGVAIGKPDMFGGGL